MKRFLTLILAVCLVLSLAACADNTGKKPDDTKPTPGGTTPVTDTPGTDTPATAPIDSISLEDIVTIMTDMSGLQFGSFYAQVPVDGQEDAAFLMGYDGFKGSFESALSFGPMMGSEPFQMVVFRLAEGADANAFAADIKANANPGKWICVCADTVETRVSGRTVLFLMCTNEKVKPLCDSFAAVSADGFDPTKYEKRDPLEDVTMENFYYTLMDNFGFLADANRTAVNAESGYGLSGVDSATFTDSVMDYNSTSDGSYVLAAFRVAAGTEAEAFAAALAQTLDGSTLAGENPNSFTAYGKDVVVIFTGTDFLADCALDLNNLLSNQYGMTIVNN